MWLLYGLSIQSVPLILVDAAGLLCGLIMLSMRGSFLRPGSWGTCPERCQDTADSAPGDPGPHRWLTRSPCPVGP